MESRRTGRPAAGCLQAWDSTSNPAIISETPATHCCDMVVTNSKQASEVTVQATITVSQHVDVSVRKTACSAAYDASRGRLCVKEALPSLEDLRQGKDRPLLLRPDAVRGCQQVVSSQHGHVKAPAADDRITAGIPMNSLHPIHFETSMFVGKALVLVRGLATTPPGVFDGKRRQTWFALQGRFKQAVSFDDLVISQEYERGLKFGYGGSWMWKGFSKVAELMSPCTEVGPRHAPHISIPLMAKAQAVQMSKPGTEPDLSKLEEIEDLRLLGREFALANGQPLPASERVRMFEKASNRQRFSFDTEHLWTFHGFQHLINVARFCLDLSFLVPGLRYDLARYVDGQPMQLAMKHRSTGQYLTAFELWHEAVLQDAHSRRTALGCADKT